MSNKYIDVIIADRPTRDKILGAAADGGLGYTDAEGSVHQIDAKYISGGGTGGGYDFNIKIDATSQDDPPIIAIVSGSYTDLLGIFDEGEFINGVLSLQTSDTNITYYTCSSMDTYNVEEAHTFDLEMDSKTEGGVPKIYITWASDDTITFTVPEGE